jgi:hypothetical protein
MKTVIVAQVLEERITFVLVVTHQFGSADECVEAIKTHVAAWLRDTEAGQAAFRESCEDFNWGDLVTHLGVLPAIPGIDSMVCIEPDGQANCICVLHDEHFID